MKQSIIAAAAAVITTVTSIAYAGDTVTRAGHIAQPCSVWNDAVGGNPPDDVERLFYEIAVQAYISGIAAASFGHHDYMSTHYTWQDSEEWVSNGCANDPDRKIFTVVEDYILFLEYTE